MVRQASLIELKNKAGALFIDEQTAQKANMVNNLSKPPVQELGK